MALTPAEESTIRGVYEQLRQISKCLDGASGSAMGLVYTIEGSVEEAILLCEEVLKDY